MDFHSGKVSFFENFQREFDSEPAFLAYLMAQLPRVKVTIAPRKNPYNPGPKALKPKTAHGLNESQLQSFEDFKSWGEPLSPAFSQAELKGAFRRLAKKLHPDLSLRSGNEFIALREAFQRLSNVFLKSGA